MFCINLHYRFLLIFIFYLFSSCSNKNFEEKPNLSKTFLEYLNNNYSKELLQKELYFVIPSSTCIGCAMFTYEYFIENNKKNFILIVSNSYIINEFNLLNKEDSNILIDLNQNIDKLNLNLSGSSVIIIDNYKIKRIKEIDPVNFKLDEN